jgi:glyoxylase-like metal-dependent hydrolase (beta-lactamase superfamily II)
MPRGGRSFHEARYWSEMRLSDRCYAVTGLGYSTPWYVNAGFIAGDRVTLVVDTGANALAAATIHGYASAVAPENALRVINTEKHFDHIGGNGFFRDRGADVWGHPGIARTAEEFTAELAEFDAAIPNAARRARGEARAFFHATRLENPNRRIDSASAQDLGGCSVEILPTPGHTPTNVSVWVASEGVLYTGDCLIREYLPNLDAGSEADWRIWLDSIDRLEALRSEVVVAGHGPVSRGREVAVMIDEVRRVLREAIACGRSPTGE